jgi:hypothetical protein
MSTSITLLLSTLCRQGLLFAGTAILGVSAFAQPQIISPEPEYDFGEGKSGSTISHEFTLQNLGNAQLNIHQIQTSCGCTTMAIRTLSIEPGEEKSLKVELDLTGRSGKQFQQVMLHSNDPKNPVYRLRIGGEAVPEILVEPRTLNLQQINPDEPHEGNVTLTSTTGEPFTILQAKANRGRIDVEVEKLNGGLKHVIRVKPKSVEAQGQFTDVLEIETSNPTLKRFRVLVMWQISTGISVAPGQLNLVMGQTEQRLDRYLMVRGYPGLEVPLEVIGAEWPGRDVEIEIQDTQRFGWRIHLKAFFPQSDMHGEELLIHTNAEGFETLRVPVRVVN